MRHDLIYQKANGYLCSAYWIAFGPHGPRALPPPGENWMVFRWTMYGVGISFVIFWIIRQFARPAPGTMTAEYQEMTNEYLKVSGLHILPYLSQAPHIHSTNMFSPKRTKKPNPSPVSPPKVTQAKEWCKASRDADHLQATMNEGRSHDCILISCKHQHPVNLSQKVFFMLSGKGMVGRLECQRERGIGVVCYSVYSWGDVQMHYKIYSMLVKSLRFLYWIKDIVTHQSDYILMLCSLDYLSIGKCSECGSQIFRT